MAAIRARRPGTARRGRAGERQASCGTHTTREATMILVVGATGTVGGLVARRLLARGESVRVLVRDPRAVGPLVEGGAAPAYGDLKDPASLAAALDGVEGVVTTANSALR